MLKCKDYKNNIYILKSVKEEML